jgi:hypothetical protein
MRRTDVLRGLTTFFVALYGVYMLALVVVGAGLRSGLLPGPAPFGLTVVPAVFGAGVIVAALALSLLPGEAGPPHPSAADEPSPRWPWPGRPPRSLPESGAPSASCAPATRR